MTTRLRHERLARGMTLRELAADIGGGTTFQALSYLERGDVRCPRPGLRLRLERYFGLRVAVLLRPYPGNANDLPEEVVQEGRHSRFVAAAPGAAQDGASHGS